MRGNVTVQGVTIGTVCAAITALFTFLFHRSMPVALTAFLPVIVGAFAHYVGFNFAMVRNFQNQIKQEKPRGS